MSQSARVTSVEAVKEFRPALIIFCEQAKDALSSVDMETRNLLDWLQRDQLGYWQRQLRLRQEEVSEAKAELFRRQLPGIRGEKPDCRIIPPARSQFPWFCGRLKMPILK